MEAKEVAARAAVAYVESGMVLGLGSGSTATFAIQAIGKRVREEGLRVRGVPTSSRSRELAEALDIPLVELTEIGEIDLTIDGADEVDPDLHLIKGGGGALVREKLVASASREVVIICDESKLVPTLGAYPLPVAVIPFAWQTTCERLLQFCKVITLRQRPDGMGVVVTDDGLYILDLHMSCIADPESLEKNVKLTSGVVEVGLFVGLTSRLILGSADGRVEERLPRAR